MTTSPPGEDPTNSNSEDLTRIRGIGPVKQQWLREALNVRSFQDLANLSADELEARLRAEGQITSRSEIEAWIAQAQELTREPSQPPTPTPEPPTAAATPPPQPAEPSPIPAREEAGWQTFASFSVEFRAKQTEGQTERRTTAYHRQADLSQTWPGIETDQLLHWLLAQLNEPEPPPEPVAPPLSLEITQIRLFQPPQAPNPVSLGEANRHFSGSLKAQEPFSLEISFQLLGGTASPRGASYTIECYGRNRTTGATVQLGDPWSAALVPGQQTYTVQLPSAVLLPGTYRLQVIATLPNTSATPGYFEIPLLQVV